MRIWELSDNKALPSDLVREQDFIMRVRRMQRHGIASIVINFILNAIEPLARNATAMEEMQTKLKEIARATKGFYSEMSNGDVFISWEQPDKISLAAIQEVEAMLKESGADTRQSLATYKMPENYTMLRERTNYYVETSRSASFISEETAKVESSEGRLTAKNVDQIEQILGEIDLRRYGRTQNFYRIVGDEWKPLGEEYFISFEDFRRERFPKLQISSPEHFFLALCGVLDQRLLAMLTSSYEIISGRMINLNVSVTSITGAIFAQFVHRVPHEHRGLIGFEVHCGDLFQDFSLALDAIGLIKREGFRVILDSVTPDMVDYLDLTAFAVDTVKINVSKDRALQLETPAVRLGLERLPADKLTFYRCDNQRALKIGRELGISLFQGWLIDDLASKKK